MYELSARNVLTYVLWCFVVYLLLDPPTKQVTIIIRLSWFILHNVTPLSPSWRLCLCLFPFTFRFQASHREVAEIFGLLHGIDWFATDISGQRFGPIFKGQCVQKRKPRRTFSSWTYWLLKIKPIRCPETNKKSEDIIHYVFRQTGRDIIWTKW